ncbi:MAG: hypothetical protein V3R29_01480 [Candidatus Acidoferrales bacterium]
MNWLQQNWPRVVLRGFGLLHIAFGVWGIYFLLWAVVGYAVRWNEPRNPDLPYLREVFAVRTTINIVFLVVLFFAGIWLLRLRTQGVRASNWLFISFIAYFFADSLQFIVEFSLYGDIGPVGRSIGATAGTGNMGTVPLLLTGYPIIALIGLNVAHKSFRQKKTSASTGG